MTNYDIIQQLSIAEMRQLFRNMEDAGGITAYCSNQFCNQCNVDNCNMDKDTCKYIDNDDVLWWLHQKA